MYQPSFGMSGGMYGSAFPQTFNPVPMEGKGKGKSREEAFEAAFQQFVDFQPQSSAKIEEVNDVSDIEKAMNSTSLEEAEGEESLTNEDFKKFESTASCICYYLIIRNFLGLGSNCAIQSCPHQKEI